MSKKLSLLRFGLMVFNHEKRKFRNWLGHKNISIGGVVPNDIINTDEGMELIRECLNRIEYGMFC